MNIQTAKNFVGDFNNELSDSTWDILVDVFTMLGQLCTGRHDEERKLAMSAATTIAFGDMKLEDYFDVLERQDHTDDDAKAALVGAFLTASKMDGDSLETTANNQGLTDYLTIETVLCYLPKEHWMKPFK